MINVLIPAAGHGHRMGSPARTPKGMLEIHGRRLVDYVLDCLGGLPVGEVSVVIGPGGAELKKHLQKSRADLRFAFVVQDEPRGLVDAFSRALPHAQGNDLLLLLSDEIYFRPRFIEAYEVFRAGAFPLVVGLEDRVDPAQIEETYSVRVDGGKIVALAEKPTEPEGSVRGTGAVFFGKSAVEFLLRNPAPDPHLPDMIRRLIHAGLDAAPFIIAEKYFNINTPETLRSAAEFLEGP